MHGDAISTQCCRQMPTAGGASSHDHSDPIEPATDLHATLIQPISTFTNLMSAVCQGRFCTQVTVWSSHRLFLRLAVHYNGSTVGHSRIFGIKLLQGVVELQS